MAVFAGSAQAADLNAQLSEAESRLAAAQAGVDRAEAEVSAAADGLGTATRHAAPALARARSTRADARALRASLGARQRRAGSRIQELEAAHAREVDDHDEEVALALGIALAALIGAAIALAWDRFRASAAVAALGRADRGQALGVCLGAGFLLIVIGVALTGTGGAGGVLGAFLLCLGFILPTAFLLGRHWAEIQRGRAKPVLERARLPRWVSRGVAALLLLLVVSGLGFWIFAEQPATLSPPAQLREDRLALERGPGADRLAEIEAKAKAAAEAAAQPAARQETAAAALRQVTGELRRAKRILAGAEADQRRFSRRLAVLVAHEEREAAREAAQAEREAEEAAEAQAEEEASSGCDPNYSGCVPSYPPDVDCDEVGETVSVLGADPHGLDADGDLVGCE